ncbi:serine/threonine-protein kinase [Azospirillum soli]|uniref:serine/threonine-protein kinase n=1 Tax=Azospirillum soli TaxID=1304799 RepID=UPI001FE9E092|nr:serine/threonine-protein kinase [Azospirillum soli]
MTTTRPATVASGTVGALDEADLCHTLADFHGVQGRMVIGLSVRPYLDAHVLTPTEVIHNNKLLKALLEQGQLVENAIVKVATMQARAPGQDAKSRRLAIQNAINETSVKARAAQVAFAGLPKGRAPVDAVVAALPARTPTGDVDYDLRVALSLDLAEHRTWSAKLDRLIQLCQQDRDERLMAAVDGVIGDVLASVAATQELFGAPLLPGAVLLKLCEMLFGRVGIDPRGANRIGTLNGWFRQGKLPLARAMVLERIRRQLRAPQPLGRGQAAEEAEILRSLLGHLLTPSGMIGGGPMADALTVRYSRRLEQGGASAYRRSIVGLSETQTDLIRRIHYLSAVSTVPASERHLGEIVDALDAALGNELLVENMILQSPDTALVRQGLSGAVEALRASGLPDKAKDRIAGRTEFIVDEFTKKGRLAQRLRQIEPVLRRRTIRLAELACSGLVREQGALPLLRQHILEIVRQPQFQSDLVAQQNDELAQAEVRRLYELLDKLRPVPATQPGSVATAPMVPTPPAARVSAQPVTVATAAETVVADLSTRAMVTAPMPQSPGGLSRRSDADGLCPACFAPTAPRESCRDCGYPMQSENRNGVHLMPGTTLQGRYKVGRILGQGGFGATYLGWDDRLHIKVAVKEFFPANLISRVSGSLGVMPFSDEHGRGFAAGLVKFLDEARLLARLRDVKEIVGVQDFFEANETAYLVMELLEGRTMKKYVAESGGRIDARRTLAILSPIMKALQAVHEQGLIHRDISPDNIFLTTSGERKLLDFGAARHAAGQAASMTVILKPGYAPPEQYSQDGNQGPWTDVYAVCATAYGALTGKTPPDATSRFMNDKVPKPSELGVNLPPAFENVLLAGLSMRWQDRPQSMRDLLRAMSGTLA